MRRGYRAEICLKVKPEQRGELSFSVESKTSSCYYQLRQFAYDHLKKMNTYDVTSAFHLCIYQGIL